MQNRVIMVAIIAATIVNCGSECEKGFVLDGSTCAAEVAFDVVCEDSYTTVNCWSADMESEVEINAQEKRYSCVWNNAIYQRRFRDVYVMVYFKALGDNCYQLEDIYIPPAANCRAQE